MGRNWTGTTVGINDWMIIKLNYNKLNTAWNSPDVHQSSEIPKTSIATEPQTYLWNVQAFWTALQQTFEDH